MYPVRLSTGSCPDQRLRQGRAQSQDFRVGLAGDRTCPSLAAPGLSPSLLPPLGIFTRVQVLSPLGNLPCPCSSCRKLSLTCHTPLGLVSATSPSHVPCGVTHCVGVSRLPRPSGPAQQTVVTRLSLGRPACDSHSGHWSGHVTLGTRFSFVLVLASGANGPCLRVAEDSVKMRSLTESPWPHSGRLHHVLSGGSVSGMWQRCGTSSHRRNGQNLTARGPPVVPPSYGAPALACASLGMPSRP